MVSLLDMRFDISKIINNKMLRLQQRISASLENENGLRMPSVTHQDWHEIELKITNKNGPTVLDLKRYAIEDKALSIALDKSAHYLSRLSNISLIESKKKILSVLKHDRVSKSSKLRTFMFLKSVDDDIFEHCDNCGMINDEGWQECYYCDELNAYL